MNQPMLVCALLLTATAALGAQEASSSSPYEGTSTPPPDDTVMTTRTPQAKPSAGRSATPAQAQPQAQEQNQPTMVTNPAVEPDSEASANEQEAPAPERTALKTRVYAADPDGDIVHPRPLRPGELEAGTTIRVELLEGLSTVSSEQGERFRSRVRVDVLQGDTVLIPAGTEIDGHVAEVSSGSLGGHGSMLLRPETMILSNGKRYRIHAGLSKTPGSKNRIGSEGTVEPGSRAKRDSIEYGGAVGAGATTGAIVGGPVGALAGGLIGAGVVTAHLLVSHPQARLDQGATLEFTLSEPLLISLDDAQRP